MANAYATIADGGERADVHVIDKVVDRNGEELYSAQASPTRGRRPPTSPPTSPTRCSRWCQNGTGTAALALGRPAAGKTGTATNGRAQVSSAWFVGFTPQLSTAVMYVRGDGDDQLDGWLPSYFGGAYPGRHLDRGHAARHGGRRGGGVPAAGVRRRRAPRTTATTAAAPAPPTTQRRRRRRRRAAEPSPPTADRPGAPTEPTPTSEPPDQPLADARRRPPAPTRPRRRRPQRQLLARRAPAPPAPVRRAAARPAAAVPGGRPELAVAAAAAATRAAPVAPAVTGTSTPPGRPGRRGAQRGVGGPVGDARAAAPLVDAGAGGAALPRSASPSGMLQKAAATPRPWSDGDARYTQMCYSDLPYLYTGRGLRRAEWPYSDDAQVRARYRRSWSTRSASPTAPGAPRWVTHAVAGRPTSATATRRPADELVRRSRSSARSAPSWSSTPSASRWWPCWRPGSSAGVQPAPALGRRCLRRLTGAGAQRPGQLGPARGGAGRRGAVGVGPGPAGADRRADRARRGHQALPAVPARRAAGDLPARRAAGATSRGALAARRRPGWRPTRRRTSPGPEQWRVFWSFNSERGRRPRLAVAGGRAGRRPRPSPPHTINVASLGLLRRLVPGRAGARAAAPRDPAAGPARASWSWPASCWSTRSTRRSTCCGCCRWRCWPVRAGATRSSGRPARSSTSPRSGGTSAASSPRPAAATPASTGRDRAADGRRALPGRLVARDVLRPGRDPVRRPACEPEPRQDDERSRSNVVAV